MTTAAQHRLARVRFIRGSIDGLIKLAEAERLDILAYLLDMAKRESIDLETRLKAEGQ